MPSLERICVVGGSLAGLRAVESLRRRGFGGRVTWVGDETLEPYDRPPLSKQILEGAWQPERLALRKDGCSGLEVERRFGRKAERLDVAARVLHLDDGEAIPWDGLIIATGASPRRLRNTPHRSGIHTLRTLDDALALRSAVEHGARVVVVGAGFIGLEVASSLRKLGRDVTVIETMTIPLERAVGPEMGTALARMHRDEGVDLRTGVGVSALAGEARVEAVELDDGTRIDADIVLVAIGVAPNTGWLEGSGVAVSDGVVCDARLATNVPGVVAAGDVARWPHAAFGETMRIEHWTNAVEQADAAAARLLDGPDVPPFATVPYFWSDQHGVKVQFAGRYAPGDAIRLVEGSVDERRAVVVYGRAGRLTGVLALGRPQALVKYRQLIAAGAPFDS